MVINIIRTEEGLVQYGDNFPEGPESFFANVSQETFVISNTIVILQALLGDGVVVSSIVYLPFEIDIEGILDKDLSLLYRLANRLGYHPTQYAVVQCRRLGFTYTQQVACSDIVSK
jgi:hypothetical protein